MPAFDYGLMPAIVEEMKGDSYTLFIIHNGIPYPDMMDEEDYNGAPVYLSKQLNPIRIQDHGGDYLGYFVEGDKHIDVFAFKNLMEKYYAELIFEEVVYRTQGSQIPTNKGTNNVKKPKTN